MRSMGVGILGAALSMTAVGAALLAPQAGTEGVDYSTTHYYSEGGGVARPPVLGRDAARSSGVGIGTVAADGAVMLTHAQTRLGTRLGAEWALPERRPSDATALLLNESTMEGWLATHSAWLQPPPCLRQVDDGDGTLVTGLGFAGDGVTTTYDERLGHGHPAVTHEVYMPVCTDESLAPDLWVRRDLHGRQCAVPSCMGEAAAAACRPTEPDLPGPFYQPGVRPSATVGHAVVCPASSYKAVAAADDDGVVPSDDDAYETGFYRTLENPYNKLKYTHAPLKVTGKIVGPARTSTYGDVTECAPVAGALVEVWQADEYGRYDREPITALAKAHAEAGTFGEEDVLRPSDGTCRAAVVADSDGQFVLDTVMPGVYGPPQMMHVRVTAPGFVPVVTNLYFDSDPWLAQLLPRNHDAIKLDSRILSIDGRPQGTDYAASEAENGFSGAVTISLGAAEAAAALDISGTWIDGEGGRVLVETDGVTWHATEVPNPRSWGTVNGLLVGGAIRAVDFRDGTGALASASVLQTSAWGGAADMLTLRWNYGHQTLEGARADWTRETKSLRYRFLRLTVLETLRVDHGGANNRPAGGYALINELEYYAGSLLRDYHPKMKMASAAVPKPLVANCSSEYGLHDPCWKAFDGNVDHTNAWRSKDVSRGPKMEGGVDRATTSTLSTPQWLELDFGADSPENWVLPTGVKIVCDPGDVGDDVASEYRDCPKAFTIEGSLDGSVYDLLYERDWLSYDDYPKEGGLFNFAYLAPTGRADGERCGSCDYSRANTDGTYCELDAVDPTCASRYCGGDGTCQPLRSKQCPAGHFLDRTETENLLLSETYECTPCPAGVYGAPRTSEEPETLLSAKCSGPCAPGHYCPEASVSPTQEDCGSSDVYCPEGSPTPRMVSSGFYSYTTDDASATGQTSGSVSGGLTGTLTGSTTGIGMSDDPTRRFAQRQCEPGFYCVGGVRHACPQGRWGGEPGLTSRECSGRCFAGSYCPIASPLPSACEPGYYCPNGEKRWECPAGRYGSVPQLASPSCSGAAKAGFFTPPGSTSPMQMPCPGGTYGETDGLTDATCTDRCPAGWYCPTASTNATAFACGGPFQYCPKGSAAPTVASAGYYTVGGNEDTHTRQIQCETGFFCVDGERYICPAGTYGAAAGLHATNDVAHHCSGFCDEGFWCGEGSTSPQQNPCPAGRYGDVEGIGTPKCSGLCAPGHWCGPNSTSAFQAKCLGGSYGNVSGLPTEACSLDCVYDDHRGLLGVGDGGDSGAASGATTSARPSTRTGGAPDEGTSAADLPPIAPLSCKPSVCHEGYYCPEGSITGRQRECGGTDRYCPWGSAEPTPVKEGWYTIGGGTGGGLQGIQGDGDFAFVAQPTQTRTNEVECPIGHFCVKGIKKPCPAGSFGAATGLSSKQCSGLAAKGHYTPEGSHSATQLKCPAGRYGAKEGLKSIGCSGRIEQGYWGGEASTSPTENECGGDGYYCPPGSGSPIKVKPGHYSVGGANATVRPKQAPCEPGVYCTEGVRYDCPAGTYGKSARLQTPACSGQAYRGHYTPPGSVSPTEVPCPAGRFGATKGLANSACSGACARSYECLEGSVDQYGRKVVGGTS